MDVKTWKRLTIGGTFHKKSNFARLHMKRKDGGTGLICVVHCVKEEHELSGYVQASDKWM